MDWRIFFKIVKFLKYIGFLITALILLGFFLIFYGHNSIVSGFLICLLSIFICYISTIGLVILCAGRKLGIKGLYIISGSIDILTATLFGYKLIGLYSQKIIALVIYLSFWMIYLKLIYLLIKDAVVFILNVKENRGI